VFRVHRGIIESEARSRSALESSILSRCVDAPVVPRRSARARARAIIACGTFRGRGEFPRSARRQMGYLAGSRKIERGPQNYKGEARAGSVASTTAALVIHVGTVLYAGIGVSRGRSRPGGFGVTRRSRRSCTREASTRFSAEEPRRARGKKRRRGRIISRRERASRSDGEARDA